MESLQEQISQQDNFLNILTLVSGLLIILIVYGVSEYYKPNLKK